MPTLAASLLQGLKDHGAREIFGIPGDFVLPFFKVDRGERDPAALHAQPRAGGRLRGRCGGALSRGLGVAVVTYGAGAFNLVNPIAGAYAERSPVVVIAGAPGARERASGFVLHHQARTVDTQLAVFREITCDQAVLDRSGDRAGRDRPRAAQRARALAAGLYRVAARHDGGADRRRCRCCRCAPADPEALAECADEIMARLARRDAPVDPGRRRDPPLRPRGSASPSWRASSGCRWSPPSWAAACSRTRPTSCSAPISAPPAIPPSPSWSRRPTRCCCSASSSPTPISRCRSAALDPRRTMLAIDREVHIGHHVYPRHADRRPDRRARRARPAARRRRAPAAAGPALSARPAGRRRADPSRRHRHRRSTTCSIAMAPMPMTSDIGDCLFTAMDIENTRARRARLLCRHGLRRARRHRRRGGDRPAAADPGRRRRLPDDRLGARQLPPLRPRSDRGAVQQCELGDAARVPAGIRVSTISTTGISPPWRASMGGHGERVTTRRRARARRWSARSRGAGSSRWSR